jgi:hypothetical protein
MKITRFWDLFYHIESVPNIKCQGIWFQVSGVRIWRIQIADYQSRSERGQITADYNEFGGDWLNE